MGDFWFLRRSVRGGAANTPGPKKAFTDWDRRGAVIAVASVFLLTWVGCAGTSLANRPETWAQPVKLAGVPNWYRVSRRTLSGRPT